MKIFIISDTHFCHKNIIEYSNRPFSDVAEMNGALIDNWNSVVKSDDLVIHLGDFCLGSKDVADHIAHSLLGHKTIILGNHDRSKNFYLQHGFQDAKKVFILPKSLSGCKHDIIFSHHPWIGLEDNQVNIHGHIHEKTLDKNLFDQSKYFNASVENIEYRPIDLQTIIKIKGW